VLWLKLGPAVIGDTVGWVYSNELEQEWVQLRGELATEMASLRLYGTGEKESVIREAQLQLAYAKEQTELQRKEVARLQTLFRKKMVPESDMEVAEATLRLYEIQVDLAEAQLHTVQTGAKEEQIDWVRSRIRSLQNEIEAVEIDNL